MNTNCFLFNTLQCISTDLCKDLVFSIALTRMFAILDSSQVVGTVELFAPYFVYFCSLALNRYSISESSKLLDSSSVKNSVLIVLSICANAFRI